MMTGGEEYSLTFNVTHMHPSKNSYPLLLSRPWLRAASAKIDWGGKKPHIIYGPLENLTKILIQSQGFLLEKTSSHSSKMRFSTYNYIMN